MMKMLAATAAGAVLLAQQPQFKLAVERIVVDVQVVDNQGRPIPTLRAEDFDVRIDQQPRTVATAQFVGAAALDTAAGGAMTATGSPAPPSTDPSSPGGRDFILAIDESSFMTRCAPAAVHCAPPGSPAQDGRDRVRGSHGGGSRRREA